MKINKQSHTTYLCVKKKTIFSTKSYHRETKIFSKHYVPSKNKRLHSVHEFGSLFIKPQNNTTPRSRQTKHKSCLFLDRQLLCLVSQCLSHKFRNTKLGECYVNVILSRIYMYMFFYIKYLLLTFHSHELLTLAVSLHS